MLKILKKRNKVELPFNRRSRSGARCFAVTIVLTIVFSIFRTLMQLTVPLYSMQIFNRILPSSSVPTLLALCVITILLLVATVFVDACRSNLCSWAANRADHQCFQRLVVHRSTDHQTADALLQDLEYLKVFLSGPLACASLDAIFSITFIIAIFILNPLLGYIGASACLVMFLFGCITHSATSGLRDSSSLEGSKLARAMDKLVYPPPYYSGMGLNERLILRVIKSRGAYRKVFCSLMQKQNWFDAAGRGLRNAIQATMLSVAAFLVISSHVAAGSIVASAMLLSRALSPIERIASNCRGLLDGFRAIHRLQTFMRMSGGIEKKFDLPVVQGKLEVEKLFFKFPSNHMPTLKDINMRVGPGSVLVVVGREGAGKSTLTRLLAGVTKPSLGEIRLDGSRLSDFDPITLGQQIGFSTPTFFIEADTVADFLARSIPDPNPNEIVRVTQLFGIHEIIQKLPNGYATQITKHLSPLSAGQLQRLCLARAFFGKPKFIVLDEPTLHLDDNGEAYLLKAVHAAKLSGCSFVIASRLPGLMHLADQLLMLEDGGVCLMADQTEIQSFFAPRLATSH